MYSYIIMSCIKNSIIEKIGNLDTVDKMLQIVQNEEIIAMGKELFIELGVDDTYNEKDIISAFCIYFFPDEILGDLSYQENKKIHDTVIQLLDLEYDNETMKIKFIEYFELFRTWKRNDSEDLKYHIQREYSELFVDIMEEENGENSQEKIKIYRDCQRKLLVHAREIGGETFHRQLMETRPVVANKKEMVEMMRKISFDGIVEATANGDFNVLDDYIAMLKNISCGLTKNLPQERMDETFSRHHMVNQNDNRLFGEELLIILKSIDFVSKEELFKFETYVRIPSNDCFSILKEYSIILENIIERISK